MRIVSLLLAICESMPFHWCYKVNYVIVSVINVNGKTEGPMRACYGDAARSGKESVEQLSFKQKSEGAEQV